MHAEKKTTAAENEADRAKFPWLVALLVASLVALVFQVFPGIWWAVVSALWTVLALFDVRTWSWKVYSCVFAVAIVVLVGIRARMQQ